MRVQQPDRAIAAYERALEQRPNDPDIASRIGRVLVTTHDYERAVKYYLSATKSGERFASMHLLTPASALLTLRGFLPPTRLPAADPSQIQLLHELAQLYLQLQQFDRAVEVLRACLARDRQDDSISARMLDVTTYTTIARVYEGLLACLPACLSCAVA